MVWTRNRVVVTGLGVLAANGIGAEAFWESLTKGKSGIGPITLFDASQMSCRIAGEIKGFEATDHIDPALKPNRMARFTQIAVAAAKMALHDAEITPDDLKLAAPIPLALGVSTSAIEVIEKQWTRMLKKGEKGVSIFSMPSLIPQAAVNELARALQVDSRLITFSTACVAGLDAISTAAEWIRSGRADLAIAGGTDTSITPFTMATFAGPRMLSTRNDDPEHASRPFDRDRDGGVMGEGSGVVILENLEHALARGATPYAEISGYGTQADPYGTDAGRGLSASMGMALANAGRRPEDVDCVSAHGPSDPEMDKTETACIKEALGQRAYAIPVISIKGATGNPLAAAGPMQLVASALSMRHGLVPPTANYKHADPACDLDYVAGRARRADVRCIVLNSHGIGGTNGSLVVERVTEP